MDRARSLIDLIQRAVKRTPDQVAVDHSDTTLTYAALDAASALLCHDLRAHGVRKGSCVILVTGHGTRNIVSILAILRCGACYVPIDRDTWSTQRIAKVIDTVSDCPLIVNTTPLLFSHGDRPVYHLQSIDQLGPVDHHHVSDIASITPQDTACIIFTSGSTGAPKGVIIPHGALVNYATTSPFNMDVRSGDRVLHILSVAFDASSGMLFSILANSGTVVPTSTDDLFVTATSCSILASTPSILASLPVPSPKNCPYPAVHTVLLGGETPPLELLKSWMSVGVKILNAYGPTEATTACTIHVVETDADSGAVRSNIIGRPMASCPVFLLDAQHNEITQDDCDGELIVSGCCLAKGYYQDMKKTESAFVQWQSTRVYRTGDVARWVRVNGNSRALEFRGRKDRTVKNRGFLVNLDADVETTMQRLSSDIESVHARIVDGQMIALVTPADLDTTRLRKLLAAHLSTFHVPDRIIAMERLPLTANGKIDCRRVELLARERLNTSPKNINQDCRLTKDTVGRTRAIVGFCMAAALNLPAEDLRADADFFSMGGNSLAALKFASECRAQGLYISPRDIYVARTWDRILCKVRRNCERPVSSTNVTTCSSELSCPLTPQQLALCVPSLDAPGLNCNQMSKRYALTHSAAVRDAWKWIRQTEPIFRTIVSLDTELGVQIVRDRPIHVLRDVTCSTRQEYDRVVAECEADLDVGLQSRIDVVAVPASEDGADLGELAVVLTIHHVLMDGFSLAHLLSKVETRLRGQLLQPSVPFCTAARDLLQLQSDRDTESRRFWQKYLSAAPTSQELDIQIPREVQSSRVTELCLDCQMHFVALKAMARAHGVTLASIYYTAWALVIASYTKQHKIVIGAVHAGQNVLLDHMETIGQLMNNLPLIVDLVSTNKVADQLKHVAMGLAQCAEFSWSSPDQVNYSTTTLVATQYDFPEYKEFIPSIQTRFFENSSFPLSLLVDDEAKFRLVGFYSSAALQELAGRLQTALRCLLESDGMESCFWWTKTEMQSNSTRIAVNSEPDWAKLIPAQTQHATLVSALEHSIDLHDDLVAVESVDECLTYSQLEKRSNFLAHKILARNLDAKTIAVWADGSVNWIIGIVAILKAGSAYCPIDPSYAGERKASVIGRSGSRAIVLPCASQSCEIEALDLQLPIITMDAPDTYSKEPSTRPNSYVEPCSDALIVFTSGTTGQPKGVPISHMGLLALQSNLEATMFSRPALRIAQYMSPAFDYCANEIFSALLHGATLVLRDPGHPNSHLTRVDVATITPSVLAVLDPSDYRNLQVVYATGEPVTPAVVSAWGLNRLFINAYGPAECSICTSFTRLTPNKPITIGRPIQTARMYVLDNDLKRLETNQPGEIYLAGLQVMRGYVGVGNDHLAKILPDPFCPGERMYRSGDYGMWNEAGDLVYIGRLDRQVKVRGYRVELPAVERQIHEQDSSVKLAVVLVANDNLVAFVQPSNVDTKALSKRLRENLQPSWMPQRIIALDAFPMTANRKVDTRALERHALQDRMNGSREGALPLQNPLQRAVAQHWKDVLKLGSCALISADDNFSALGGNSILQMLLSVRLSKEFKVAMTVRDVVANPVLSDQAMLLEEKSGSSQHSDGNKVYVKIAESDLTPLERQAWFQHQVGNSRTTFNIPVVLRLEGSFDRERLLSALNAVLQCRKVFRSNFVAVEGVPVRVLRSHAPQALQSDDIDLAAVVRKPFDIGRDPLIRVVLGTDKLLIMTSHMIADLDSVQVLLRQVAAVYRGQEVGGPRLRYLTSASWSYNVTAKETQFWTTTLRDLPEPPVPTSDALFEGRSTTKVFKGPLITKLRALGQVHAMSPHQIVSTAIAQVLQWLWKTEDVILGCPVANRHSEQDRDSCGLFLERLPIRVRSAEQATCDDLLISTKNAAQEALAHAIPFHEILTAVGLSWDLKGHPIFQTMVTFHPFRLLEDCFTIPGCTVTREHCHPPGAKFLLMFEWTELKKEEWAVRIEFDSTRMCETDIDAISQALRITLSHLVTGGSRAALHACLNERLCVHQRFEDVSARREQIIHIIRREMAACLNTDVKGLACTHSFLQAGADSIAVCRLQYRLRKVGLDVAIRDVFEYPTAKKLATFMTR